MLEMSLVLEAMLDTTKDHQYSNAIMYCLVHALSSMATKALDRIGHFAEDNKDLLAGNPSEAQATNKLQVVFRNEAQTVCGKANSIKVTLMQC